ncbi:hypothetical protein ISCGN_003323 [Ixodes scapularis]
MQDLNRRSASGPDRVSNKALRNLNDAAVTALTAYFNKCWRAGKLPRQWKEAKTILIPKPGKSPDIENLRPISLTSCVGKLLEHILMTRWQQYLEEAELYPDSLVGFRSKLGTQHAMLQLKKEIVKALPHGVAEACGATVGPAICRPDPVFGFNGATYDAAEPTAPCAVQSSPPLAAEERNHWHVA